MLLSKERFIEIINEVNNVMKYDSDLNKLYIKYHVDGYLHQPDCTCTVLSLLHIIFGEADKDEWISYFCFELDFGRAYKDGMVLDKDGKVINLSDATHLYDFLLNKY